MIRKITPSDKELYLKLTDEFYKSDAVMHRIDSENFELTWQELMRSGDYTECFIIEKDGETAGYMLLAYTFSQEAGGKTAWIEEIFILPQFRSKGLGKEAFAFIKNNIEPQCARLRLEVEEDNVKAKKLYASLGFEMLEYRQMIKELK
mgnify:FL=1